MDEYIKRKAAYTRIMNNKRWAHSPSDMEYAADLVLTVPAADVVEVRHGEWIKDCDTLVHCSVCKVARNNYFGVGGNLWHYCPNCGAKMDGDKK